MRPLLLVALLLAPASAHAALAVENSTSCVSSGASTCTTPAITSTTGNLFVGSASYFQSPTTFSITDSKSNTYSSGVAQFSDTCTGFAQQRYKANGAGGSGHTFTVTTTGTTGYITLGVVEVSGAHASSPLDQTATDTDATGTSHATDSTATLSQSGEIAIGFGSSSVTGTTFTNDSGAGWTEQVNRATDVDTEGLLVSTKILSDTTGISYTYTTSGGTGCTAHGVGTYRSAIAGGDQENPTTPSGFAAAAPGNTGIDLGWGISTDNVAVFQYRIERCSGSSCSDFSEVTTVTHPTVTYADRSLTPNVLYRYRVRAEDTTGNFSTYASTVEATTRTARPHLAWTDNASDETGFTIERRTPCGSGTWSSAGTVGAGVTAWHDSSPADAPEAEYRVYATKTGSADSDPTNTVCFVKERTKNTFSGRDRTAPPVGLRQR